MEYLSYMEIDNICHKPPCVQTLLEGHKSIKAVHVNLFSYCRDTFGKGSNFFDLTEQILVELISKA